MIGSLQGAGVADDASGQPFAAVEVPVKGSNTTALIAGAHYSDGI